MCFSVLKSAGLLRLHLVTDYDHILEAINYQVKKTNPTLQTTFPKPLTLEKWRAQHPGHVVTCKEKCVYVYTVNTFINK